MAKKMRSWILVTPMMILPVLVLVLFVSFCLFPAMPQSTAEAKGANIKIVVNNPYSLSMNLEVKCDWNHQEKKFDYHEHIIVKSNTTTVLSVPKGMKTCEIWPHIKFF